MEPLHTRWSRRASRLPGGPFPHCHAGTTFHGRLLIVRRHLTRWQQSRIASAMHISRECVGFNPHPARRLGATHFPVPSGCFPETSPPFNTHSSSSHRFAATDVDLPSHKGAKRFALPARTLPRFSHHCRSAQRQRVSQGMPPLHADYLQGSGIRLRHDPEAASRAAARYGA